MTGDELTLMELTEPLEYNGKMLPVGFKYPFPRKDAIALLRDGRATIASVKRTVPDGGGFVPASSLSVPVTTINAVISSGLEKLIIKHGGKEKIFDWDLKTGKSSIHYDALVPLMADYLKSISFKDMIYSWDYPRKMYVPGMSRIYAAIQELTQICGEPGSVITLNQKLPVYLRGINVYQDYPFNQNNEVIPFRNRCLRLIDGTWQKDYTQASDLLTWRLAADYNPDAPTAPVLEVLKSWVSPDDAIRLIRAPALALSQRIDKTIFKINYILVGPPDAGKTMYMRLLQDSVGMDLYCDVPLQDVGKRFSHSTLEGKLLNIHDDLPDRALQDTGLFKALTGSNRHDIERKHQLQYSGWITAVHIFSCNRPPKVPDSEDMAFFGRWELVTFSNCFTKDGGWYNRTITPLFLSGFLNLVIDEYKKIRSTGTTTIGDALQVREAWLTESTPEYRFINMTMRRGADQRITTVNCYSQYQDWCKEKKVAIKSDVAFGMILARLGIGKIHGAVKGKRFNVYTGIGDPEKPYKDDTQGTLEGESE